MDISEEPLLEDRNAPGTQKKVIELLRAMPSGKLLDAPSGEGALGQRLRGDYDLVCVDIDENFFKLKGVPFHRVDLNDTLPFEDETFDYITSVEGIEHLENPFKCIREFARVLKPDGTLILTTPNIMSIKSRTRFFLYSYHDFFRFITLEGEYRHSQTEYEHQHINPMTFQELRYALNKAGLSVSSIHTNRYVKAKRLGIFYPLVKKLITSRTKKRSKDDFFLVSREVLEGEILIIKAGKY